MSPGVACEAGVLLQQPGWWRSNAATSFDSQLYPCYTDTCLGSTSDAAGLPSLTAQCKRGYTGPVCALCADGYTMQFGSCELCSGLNAQSVTGVTLFALAVIGTCVFVYCRRDSPLLQPAIVKITVRHCCCCCCCCCCCYFFVHLLLMPACLLLLW